MRNFARIEHGLVAELFPTDQNVETLFNPALVWIDVTDQPEVAEGWTYDGSRFSAPAAPAVPPSPSLSTLQAELQALSAKIQALTSS